MIKAALFDIDGTLIDSNDLHVEAWHQVFAEAGYDIDRAAIHEQIGKGGDNLVPALLPDLEKPVQRALAEGHGRLFKQLFLDRAKPFPAARDLLLRVQAMGLQVVLASSASEVEVEHYLDLLDARAIVLATTSIDDVATSKPAPDIFVAALKKASVAPAESLAIGDTPYDITSAGQVGIGTIALLSGGFSRSTLKQAGALAIYHNAADLLAQFDRSLLGTA